MSDALETEWEYIGNGVAAGHSVGGDRKRPDLKQLVGSAIVIDAANVHAGNNVHIFILWQRIVETGERNAS